MDESSKKEPSTFKWQFLPESWRQYIITSHTQLLTASSILCECSMIVKACMYSLAEVWLPTRLRTSSCELVIAKFIPANCFSSNPPNIILVGIMFGGYYTVHENSTSIGQGIFCLNIGLLMITRPCKTCMYIHTCVILLCMTSYIHVHYTCERFSIGFY